MSALRNRRDTPEDNVISRYFARHARALDAGMRVSGTDHPKFVSFDHRLIETAAPGRDSLGRSMGVRDGAGLWQAMVSHRLPFRLARRKPHAHSSKPARSATIHTS